MAQWAHWEPCEGNEAAVTLSHLAASRPEYFADATLAAARAAEEIVFGAGNVGGGAGGPDQHSDLAVATRLATLIVCQSGLGDDGGLRWTADPSASQEGEIDELLRKTYDQTRVGLREHRSLLDRVAEVLEQKQELSGNELRLLASSSAAA